MEPPKKFQHIPELPYEIWNQILLLLPAITVIELKIVCKSWCELINNKNFQNSHVDRWRIRVIAGTTTSSQLINLLPSRPILHSLESVSDDDMIPSKIHCRLLRFDQFLPRRSQPPLLAGQTKLTVLCCYDGLFLVTVTNHLFLCNPLTKSYLPLPLLLPEEEKLFNRQWTVVYDPSTRCYVIFYETRNHVIYSLRVDLNGSGGRIIGDWQELWRSSQLRHIFPRTLFMDFRARISIDGKAHWLFYYYYYKCHTATGILTIDAATEELTVKRCPDEPISGDFFNSNKKFYCLVEPDSPREVLELWAVDDVDNPKWLKKHTIVIDPSLRPNVCGVLKQGSRLFVNLLNPDSRDPLIYDIRLKKWQAVDIARINGSNNVSDNYWITQESVMPVQYSLLSWN